jgi:sugar fermentation stimulation protein A
MRFGSPLIPAVLVRRYKRFLADVLLDDGSEATVHCPNPGSMMGLAEPGMRVWLEPAPPGRKMPYAWRLVELPGGHLAGIDTTVPNRVVGEALRDRAIPALAGYGTVRPEQRYGERSRVGFLLTEPGLPDAYVEVKNVHLRREGDWAEFPDCVTARGARHLGELARMAAAGDKAVMLYLVQRTDCARFRLAEDIDRAYATAAAAAHSAGVETLCYGSRIDYSGVTLGVQCPVRFASGDAGAYLSR